MKPSVIETSNQLLHNSIFRIILSIFLYTTGILVLFSNIKYCEFTGDETYQMTCIRYFKDAPLAMMTFFNGHVWSELFGFSFLSFRILCRICYIIAIGCGVIFLYIKTHNHLLSAFIFFISCFIATLGSFGIYNWDTGAYPIEAIGIITLMFFLQKPSFLKIIIIGSMTGIMTCTRLPLALFSIICLVSLIFVYRDNRISLQCLLSYLAIGIASMFTAIFICGIIMTGSFLDYVNAFNSNNIISGHGFKDIEVFIWRFKMVFPYVCIATTPVALCYLCANWIQGESNLLLKIFIFSLLCILLGWSVLRIIALHECYDQPIFGLGVTFVIITSLVYPFFIIDKNSIPTDGNLIKQQSIIILSSLILLGVGSDTAFERFNTTFLFPISMGVLWPILNKNSKTTIKLWLSFCAVTFIFIWSYKSYCISDDYTSTPSDIPLRENIPAPSLGHEFYNDFRNDIEPIIEKNEKYAVWGSYRYYVMLAYNRKPEYSMHLFHYGDKDITKIFPNVLNKKYVFLTHWPDYQNDMEKSMESLIIHGFKIKKKTNTYLLLENGNI